MTLKNTLHETQSNVTNATSPSTTVTEEPNDAESDTVEFLANDNSKENSVVQQQNNGVEFKSLEHNSPEALERNKTALEVRQSLRLMANISSVTINGKNIQLEDEMASLNLIKGNFCNFTIFFLYDCTIA